MEFEKEKLRIFTISILMSICVFITYYFHTIEGIGTVFTHFFYIPIILASCWWKRRGLVAAVFLSLFLIFSHIYLRSDVLTINDYFQALMLIIVSLLVTMLSKEIEKEERIIRKSEEKYKTLYKSSMDAIMMLTPGEGFFSGNPASIKMFGCADEKDFISKNPADLSPEYQPDGTLSAEKAQSMMAIAMEKGSHFFEWTHKQVDGKEFYATVLLTRMELQGKDILQATVRNITEYKKAEEALQYERNLFKTLLNNIPDAIYFKDKESRLVRISESYAQWLNMNTEKIIGKTDADLFEKNLGEKWVKEEYEIIKTGEPMINKEEEEETVDGKKRWVSSTKLPWYDKNNNIIGTFGISRNITKRKKVEVALKQLKNSYQDLYDDAPIGYHEIDRDGKIVRVNKTEAQMLGYTVDEMVGRQFFDFVDIDDKEKSKAAVCSKFNGEEPVKPFECKFRRKDGSVLDVLLIDKLIRDVKGNVTGIRTTVQDITERKILEEEKSKADRLEAINNMIVTINHEMNQPLSVITSYADYLMKNVDKDSQTYKDVKLISDEAWKMVKLVKKIGRIKDIKTVEYLRGVGMIDLSDIDD